MPEKPRVFISYARSDGEGFATDLRKRLEAENLTLWQDRARMEGGVGWWQQITEALETVEFMVLVATPNAMKSPIVTKEWRYARQQGVCVYPVQAPGLPIDFAALPRWMSDSHFYDLTKEWETFVNYLKNPCHAVRVPFMAPDLPEHFVKRDKEFGQLIGLLLDANRQNPVAITTALKGAGGFGKTTLATALCHDEDVQTAFDDGILWVTLGENPNLVDALTKVYAALTGERPGFVDVEDAAKNLADKLADKDCLLVIDDVWNIAHLRPFLRGGERCARLVTTRILLVAVHEGGNPIHVDEMTTPEAAQMLKTSIKPLPTDDTPFHKLAQRLGEWPLLLEITNGQIRELMSMGDSLERTLEWINQTLDAEGISAIQRDDEEQRKRSADGTLQASLRLLSEEEQTRYIELAIFPEDIDIPLAAVGALWDSNPYKTKNLILKLNRLSLLKLNPELDTFRLHDVVRLCLATRLQNASHHLHARLIDAWGDPYALPDAYAWRWYAYHLVNANRADKLCELLTDFKWLQAKLNYGGLRLDSGLTLDSGFRLDTNITELIADFDYVASDDVDFNLIQSALRLSAHVLAQDKMQLASQLIGRLLLYCPPYSNFEEGVGDKIGNLLEGAKTHKASTWICPLTPCLEPPGGALLRTLSGHGDMVRGVSITPDGRFAVSASHDGTLKIWDLATGSEVRTLSSHNGGVLGLSITPDGGLCVSASSDRTLKVWDLATGSEVRTLSGHNRPVLGLSITPDGGLCVSASYDRTLKVWDLATGSEVRTLSGHSGWVYGVSITPDGRFAVSASGDNTLKVWNLPTGSEVRTLSGHSDQVNGVGITPDGRYAISASADGTLKVWDLATGSEVRTLSGHSSWVYGVSITPDGRFAVSASGDNTLKVWDLATGSEVRTLSGHSGWVYGVSITPDGRFAVSASFDGTLKVWDLEAASADSTLPSHSGGVNEVEITPDGRFAVSASADGTLKVWDLATGSEVRTLSGHSSGVLGLSITPNGRFAVSASGDSTLKVWDLATGSEVRTLSDYSGSVHRVSVTPDGRYAVSASGDRTLKVWDLATGSEVRTLSGHELSVDGVSVTPNGRYAVSASYDNTLKVWNLVTGSEVLTLSGHDDGIKAVNITPDGRHAVSASNDKTLKVWDLATGSEVRTLSGHSNWVGGVSITPDGRMVVSASNDKTLKVWNLADGACLAIFHADAELHCCAVAPDGVTIVAGDTVGRVYFLRLEGL